MTVTDHAPVRSTTTELLRAAVAGDHTAWEQLVSRFEPVVLSVINGYRLQEADARDAAQRTWLLMIERHQQIREVEALGGWLRTTVRRECLRIIRERQRIAPLQPAEAADFPDVTVDIEQRVVDADTARQLWTMIESLPARSSLLLSTLFRDNPPGYAELARSTGIPVGSIGPTRARALSRLRRQFDEGSEASRALGCGA
jgi:RNA polymerase sigma factor (sigma-70 family)